MADMELVRVIALDEEATEPEDGQYLLTDAADGTKKMQAVKLLQNEAQTFDTSADYAVGDYVLYNGRLYRFTAVHAAGAWTGEDAERVTIADELEKVVKYDGVINVIKIISQSTTMGDIVSTLDEVNTIGDHVVFDVAALNAGMYLCTIYLGDGYYRIADMVTGFESTGFFLPSDLLVDIIKNGSQTTGKHYTMVWDQVNAQGNRLNDAANITTDTSNFRHAGSVNENYDNPFDEIYPWSGRKLCNIDIDLYRGLQNGDDLTDCVTAWEGDVGFSYSDHYGVWVYTPPFFGRSYVIGNNRYFDVTDENLQNNIYYPASITGRYLGVDVTLTIDNESKHCLLPKLGMPVANVTLQNMHTYAQNWGATLNDIYTLDATSLLFVVEYASMNLQTKLGGGVSNLYLQPSEGVHLAADVTDGTEITLEGLTAAQLANIIPNAIADIGTSNGSNDIKRTHIVSVSTIGTTTTVVLADAITATTAAFFSIHGLINVADSEIGSKSGYIGTNDKSNAYYRGQTFYANKYQYLLGAYREKDTGHIWIADEGDTDNYNALDTTKHTDTGLKLPQRANDAAYSGYIKTLGMCDKLSIPPFCIEGGGSSSNPVGDYVYVPVLSAGNTVLLFGGGAGSGAVCGFSGHWFNGAGTSHWIYGACPRLKQPS